ncbi:MAG: hypothetical protein U5R48_05540 [Gammaproteobacteria bacterium]|nr:hypothetical protein [Gammaproteobacteria bacterium]
MTVSLDDLRRRSEAGTPVEPEIHSIEGRVYIVRVDGETSPGADAVRAIRSASRVPGLPVMLWAASVSSAAGWSTARPTTR